MLEYFYIIDFCGYNMAKKKFFIDGKELKDAARLVQKYNRIIAYLGGDDELIVKMMKRIEDYKMLEVKYYELKEFPEKKDFILKQIKILNTNKRFNFFERLIEGNENEEKHFLRRAEMNRNIEKDYEKYKVLPKESKDKIISSIVNNPQYITAKRILGEGMILMCEKWATQPSYSGYSLDRKEDMLQDSCLSMLKGVEGFDCDRGSSIFAYFTETIKNCYNSFCKNKKIESDNEVGLEFLDNIQACFKWEKYGEDTHD